MLRIFFNDVELVKNESIIFSVEKNYYSEAISSWTSPLSSNYIVKKHLILDHQRQPTFEKLGESNVENFLTMRVG